MTGAHGTEAGLSGLEAKELLLQSFYNEDCKLVGVKAGPDRKPHSLPIITWEGIPDITQPAEVMESPPPGSFYDDEELRTMDIRVANMSYYFGHTQKLLDDIDEVQVRISRIISNLQLCLSSALQ